MTGADEREALPLGEVLEFMRLLWALDQALQAASKRMESTLGLTGPQRLVVRTIGRSPGITAGRLARELHLHPSTLTGVLKRLEVRGLLQRETDPRDGRRALFALTEAGRALDTHPADTEEDAVHRTLSRVAPELLEGAREVLTALAEELGGACAAPPDTVLEPRPPLLPVHGEAPTTAPPR